MRCAGKKRVKMMAQGSSLSRYHISEFVPVLLGQHRNRESFGGELARHQDRRVN
jgi:hypothetical protein